MRSRILLVALVVALSGAAGLAAQSLGEVAKAEEARRKNQKTAAKVYTNEDLGNSFSAATPPSPPAATKTPAKPGDPAAKPDEEKPADETKTENYWKARAAAIQQSLSRNKIVLGALESQLNGLNAESRNTDDPGQRGLLQERIATASAEMERVRQDIEKQTKAAADLQEEARKAGIPSGWLR